MISILFVGAMSLASSLLLSSKYSPITIHDSPNKRSLHENPTPRTGGIAILTAICIGWGILLFLGYWNEYLVWVLPAVILVASVSILDDLVDLSPVPRILVHGISASVLMIGGGVFDLSLPIIITIWIAIVWVLNLYNFMDGMDGLAAGMTISGFGVIGIAAWVHGESVYAAYSWVAAAAAAGFLTVNFPPAKLFMGDVGSVPIGLMVAAFSIWGIRDGIFPLWLPILAFSPFIVDASVTLISRLLRGEKIWEAHRSHYYQKLVLAGWGHKRTALAEYLLMFLCGMTSLIALQLEVIYQWVLLAIWAVIYTIILIIIEKKVIAEPGKK